jgi:Mg-chelatase subunit ChlD
MDQIAFESPAYLVLLAGLPLLWWSSARVAAVLGRVRGGMTIALRSLVFVLIVLALAEAQLVHTSHRLTVFYLVDQSLSVAADASDAVLRYVNGAMRAHRAGDDGDRAGVIVFGRDAAIEVPPLEGAPQLPRIETTVDRDQTNLASAMKLAQASFPHDSAKRIVVISDGNQTIGNALSQARALADSGIGIDVVPIRSATESEVSVERVVLPTDVQRGQPFELRIVLNRLSAASPEARPVAGKLLVVRRTASRQDTLVDQEIELPPGKRVYAIREEIDTPEFYHYDARFIPKLAADDHLPQNNEATAYTHVRGTGQVLLLEDHEDKGRFDLLLQRLAAMNLEVSVRSTRPGELFTDLAQLQPFDTVILGDVPRDHFSDLQIEMLVRNTRNLGAGLVMVGGPNSFGAGGWTDSPLERAMPVDFQVKNLKVVPIGALVLVIDRSGSMQGEKIRMSKAAAIAAVEVLGPADQIGVVAFDTEAHAIVPLARVGSGKQAAARISRLGADGGTNMMPGLQAGYQALLGADAAVKHLLVVSDGRTEPGGYETLAAEMRARGITTTCVAIGQDADSPLMQSIAQIGGGKFYRVDRPRTIPRIFMKEARRVSRPLIYERAGGFSPQIRDPHEMIQGIDGPLPAITGFVLTTPKNNSLVEIPLVSPEPSDHQVNAILAGWTYGLGKAVALTTDAGSRWTADWARWAQYGPLMSQIVRWSMRPQGDQGKFAIDTNLRDGRVKVVVTALDKDDEFLNFLKMDATVLAPDLSSSELPIRQVAPGRYVGEFDAGNTGNYLLVVHPGPGRAALRAGVSVTYSDEFRGRGTNDPLLLALAQVAPKAGQPGIVIDAPQTLPADERLTRWLATDTFRHDLAPATSSQPIWPALVLAASVMFLGDVCARRVAVGRDILAPLISRVRDWFTQRTAQATVEVAIERLRERKAEIAGQWAQQRTARRFERPERPAESRPSLDIEPVRGTWSTDAVEQRAEAREQASEADGYLQRLRKAKAEAKVKRRGAADSDPPTAH